MFKVSKDQLRKIFSEVINGKSIIDTQKFGFLYVKHMDYHASSNIDEKRTFFFEKAKRRGLPTSEEKEKDLISEGLWDENKNKEITDLNDYLVGLNTSKSKMILQKDIDNIKKEIERSNKELSELSNEKMELLGYTADIYAGKKVNEFYIFDTSYKNKELTEKAFSEEDFEELTDADISIMTVAHNSMSEKFSPINLKRISIAPFFMNHFYLCEDNPYTFFGKCIVELTFNQCDVFSFGKYFKHVLSEMKHKPAEEVMDDPDKLIELFEVGKGAERAIEKATEKEGTATTFVGATKEDMEKMGLATAQAKDENVVDLSEAAAKKGGKLSMEDLIKLHGV